MPAASRRDSVLSATLLAALAIERFVHDAHAAGADATHDLKPAAPQRQAGVELRVVGRQVRSERRPRREHVTRVVARIRCRIACFIDRHDPAAGIGLTTIRPR